MNVIIFGATGMVGQSALHASLLDPDVGQVLAVVRTPTGVKHPKVREVLLDDFADLTPIEDELVGYDACFYCLGVSSVGLEEAAYTRVSYEYPVAAAHTLVKINPDMTFVYVSGGGTDPSSRQMWARVKGRTENAVIETFRNGYAFRPGMVQPTFPATSKTNLFRTVYALTAPVFPLLERIAPQYAITTDRLGRAMLHAARTGFPQHIVENRDLCRSRSRMPRSRPPRPQHLRATDA
ncbi:epimerase [Actinoplanes philippinensis]|uniref:epimerase n=1 Tax=Actinoplanes philippinensis TaxID=35752 RepID=UPI0033D6F7BA